MKSGIQSLLSIPPKGALNGYLVLEIGGNISGPMAAEELARKGAQVIKVEMKGGDPSRNYLSKAVFTSCNAAKASIAIDKELPQDIQCYEKLLGLAHAIIDNRSPDAKSRDSTLQQFLKSQKSNPVIYCSIVGYDSQEYHDRPALDVAVQAEIGMAMVNGPSNNFPLKVGFVVIDTTTGLQAASEIKEYLLALQRNKVELGAQNVILLEQSMAKTGALLMSGQFLKVLTEHKETFREGNRDLWIAPFSFYKTSNGMISLAIIGEPLFAKFCEKVINQSELAIKYPTNQFRLANIVDFERELSEILLQKTSEEWIALCRQYGIVCTKVNSISDMLKEPFAAKMFSSTSDGTPIIANSCLSSAFSTREMAPAPKLDEHRKAIEEMVSLGASFEKIEREYTFDTGTLLPLYGLRISAPIPVPNNTTSAAVTNKAKL